MATIIVFPGGISPARTAMALESLGYRVDPRTGHAHPRTNHAHPRTNTRAVMDYVRRRKNANRNIGGHHDPA